jgi:uncharacterized membrane protein
MTQLLIATAIGAALVSGIFYAFSTFVMGALGRLEPRQGIAAMQSINIVVINPLFFLAFFGTGALCAANIVAALVPGTGVPLAPAVAGGVLYIVGCIGVTIAGNVPLNDRLAEVQPDDAGAESLWHMYLVRWTRWNHVRTAASLAASAFLLVAAVAV